MRKVEKPQIYNRVQKEVIGKKEVLNCIYCGRPTLHNMGESKHNQHFLLSVATLGLWLFVWWWMTDAEKNASCTICKMSHNTHPLTFGKGATAILIAVAVVGLISMAAIN